MSATPNISAWLRRAWEEPADRINETYYFDKNKREFFSVFITDYFIVMEEGENNKNPYSAEEFAILTDRISRIEANDPAIISIPRLSVEERKEIMRKFLDSNSSLADVFTDEVENESGKYAFDFNGRLDPEQENKWEGFKAESMRERIDFFCNVEGIDLDSATLWTDQKITSISFNLAEESEVAVNKDEIKPKGKPWWKFW